MQPDDLRELAKKTAKAIVDHGSLPLATLKESILLKEKVEELLVETKKKDLLDFEIDEETRERLKGDKGEKGEDGQPGLNGLNGKDGIDGKDGKDGLNGRDGVDGKDGIDGKDGRDGKDGSDANINTEDFRKKEDKLLISEVKELPEVIATLQNRTQLLNQIASQRTSAETILSTIDVSKTFTYNGDGTLNTLSSSIGTKTMSYTDGLLVRIYGSGGYKGKTLTYNGSGQLIASTIS